MKKTSLLISFLFLLLIFQNANAQIDEPCGTDVLLNSFIANNPNLLNQIGLIENSSGTNDPALTNPQTDEYIIPVVAHIIHENGVENIADSQVRQAIDLSNDQLAGVFGGFNTKIKLVLASIDPDGNCTTGINRVVSPLTNLQDYEAQDPLLKDLIRWDVNSYLNVWIVNSINGDVVGYAYYPSTLSQNPDLDGIVIEHAYLGTTGTAIDNGVPSALSHELGHYLNLLHVWGYDISMDPCGNNCHDENDCSTKGDFVCDTAPCLFSLSAASCPTFPVYTCIDCPNQNLDFPYPVENYMSYTFPCHTGLTEGQSARMYHALNVWRDGLWSEENKRCTGTNTDTNITGTNIPGTITLSNIIWNTGNLPNNGDVNVNGDLIIESGITLTIEANVVVRFCKDAKLIIKPNGRLNLLGKLTSTCGENIWSGVEIWGSTQQPQSKSTHGYLLSLSGSVIENAETAVKLYHPVTEQGGGIFIAHDNTIKNCRIGLEYKPYENMSQGQPKNYLSYFSDSKFLVDDDYPHDEPFHSFVHMTGVKGVRMWGCEFTNSMNLEGTEIDDWGYGIFANDAGFQLKEYIYNAGSSGLVAKNSTFTNLGYGIQSARIGNNQPFLVRQSDFNNCFVGIRNIGVTGSTFLFNDFVFGEPPSFDVVIEQTGICFESDISGFTCQENTFTNTVANSPINTIGIFSKETGTVNKAIRKNTFNNLTLGNLANGLNGETSTLGVPRGINYLCNQNYNVSVIGADIDVGNGEIRPKQGLPISPTDHNAGGNRFSNIGTDFKNFGDENIEYFYYISGTNETPIIDGDITETEAIENPCPTEFCEPPCKIKSEIKQMMLAHGANTSLLESAQADYLATPTDAKLTELSYYRQILDEALYTIVLHQMYDTLEYNHDTLLTWVSKFNDVSADLWLATELTANDNSLAAIQVLDNAGSIYNLTNDQADNILDYKNMVNAIGSQSIYNLDKATLTMIRNQAEIKNSAGIWAQNIMTMYGAHYPPEYLYSLGGDNLKPITNHGIENNKSKNDFINVFPNPATDLVNFQVNIPDGDTIGQLTIRDINGKVIYIVESITENETIEWNTSSVNSGIYYYELLTNGNFLKAGKVILLK